MHVGTPAHRVALNVKNKPMRSVKPLVDSKCLQLNKDYTSKNYEVNGYTSYLLRFMKSHGGTQNIVAQLSQMAPIKVLPV